MIKTRTYIELCEQVDINRKGGEIVKIKKGKIKEIKFSLDTHSVDLVIKQDSGIHDYVCDYNRTKTKALAKIFSEILTAEDELLYGAKIVGSEIFYWLDESGKFLAGLQPVNEMPKEKNTSRKKTLKQLVLEIQ
jgi:hypothetical protein